MNDFIRGISKSLISNEYSKLLNEVLVICVIDQEETHMS